MTNDLVTCPYCGYVATEGEFQKNGGCPRKDCVGFQNMTKYDNEQNDMGLKAKVNPINRMIKGGQ